MKRIAFLVITISAAIFLHAQEPQKADSFYLLSPVEVKAIRVNEKAPFAKTNLTKKEISKVNQGQDLPFILNQTPSVIVNSDAGNGVGYTGLRIRGTDATRINVTLNGIPFNDAESQGTFFVDLPDFASSLNSIQVQRGVGTSSNGTGAFGATVSLSTNELNRNAYGEINNNFGSFHTWKNTVKAGTGIIDDHFTVDARLSRISSDGYVDRAASRLHSFYLSGAYLNDRSTLRFNVFSGKEKTYQAWNGISSDQLKTDRTYNSSGTEKPGEPYDNETDNYTQTHYQLFFDHSINNNWKFNTAAFLTRGLGYYENYKAAEFFEDYGLDPIEINGETVENTDLVRQKWLDNYFYGQILSAQYQSGKNAVTIGGGWTRYDGKHYGKVIWAKYGFPDNYQYYDHNANKQDINTYAKWQHNLTDYLNVFADLQYRRVNYTMNGFEDNPDLTISRRFNFINPKAGIAFNKNGVQAFFSYARASKEPNRDDFEAGKNQQPKQETLNDLEAGIGKKTEKYNLHVGFYYMHYKDQLVLTGQINDVGAATRINVPQSYRAGIEWQGGYVFANWINVAANLTLSRNKIKSFTEYMDQYDSDWNWTGQHTVAHRQTDIAFSPSVVGAGALNFFPAKNLELSFLSKYVSRQYLDNTENSDRMLPSYFTEDIRAILSFEKKVFRQWNITAQVNNIFNKEYEANGWTYPYQFAGEVTADNGYYPMAGVNFMVGVNIRL